MIRRRHAIALALAAWVGDGAPAAQAQSLGLASGEVLRGRFTQQRFLQGFNAPLTSSGSFIVAPGRGIVWRGEAPFAIVTVMGPGGLVQRVAGGATTHYPASRLPAIARLYEIFAAALSGDWQKLAAVFEVQRDGTANDWTATLTPLRSGEGGMPLRLVARARRPLRRFRGGHARQRRPRPHRLQPAGAVAGADRRRKQRASRHGRASMRRVAGGGLAGDRRRRGRLSDGRWASPGFPIRTDLLALLPREERDPVVQQANEAVSRSLGRRLLLAFGDSRSRDAPARPPDRRRRHRRPPAWSTRSTARRCRMPAGGSRHSTFPIATPC